MGFLVSLFLFFDGPKNESAYSYSGSSWADFVGVIEFANGFKFIPMLFLNEFLLARSEVYLYSWTIGNRF